MDVSALEGQELTAVEFVADYLRLRFDGPMLTLYAWPHVLLSDFSIAFGEPEYRNALCAQIGEMVGTAKLEELDSLTVEFESGTVIALSLREEDLDGPESGSYSEDGRARATRSSSSRHTVRQASRRTRAVIAIKSTRTSPQW